MSIESQIKIQLPARAENVALVRHTIAGSAEALGMDENYLADLKTVVTEACMNVVQHAYDEEGGPLEVHSCRDDGEFVVVVRDSGHGIRPRADIESESLRLGLSLIASMTSGFEIAGGAGTGTSITMRLSLPGQATGEPFTDGQARDQEWGDNGSDLLASDRITLTAWDVAALAPILARVVSVLAARGELSVDQLTDAMLFSDAIADDMARNAPRDRIDVHMDEIPGGMGLKVGPLGQGGADTLRESLALPEELGGSLEALAESVGVERDGEGEYLVARFGVPVTSD